MADPSGNIPVEVIFNPNWWNQNYGVSFERPFYFDAAARIQNDLTMRKALWERFEIGEAEPQPRPVIGSMFVAGGFVVPALFGVEVRFAADAAPAPVPLDLTPEQIEALQAPDLAITWPMDQLIRDMDALQAEYGYVLGDVDTDGILNTAIHLRGLELWTDFKKNPALIHRLFSVIAETTLAVAETVKRRTGTCALATNRSIVNVDPRIYLHSNCSVQMISPKTYEEFVLPHESRLAEAMRPYGIHHCGNNLERYAEGYKKTGAVFLDVGWGSNVAECRQAFPEAFLNLRVSPMDMLWKSAAEIREITTRLLTDGYAPGKTGVCCINMDYGTPDENVKAMMEAARTFNQYE